MRKSKGAPAQTVDEYLDGVPKEARTALQRVRRIIRVAAPEATETVTYRIPIFKHYGMLVGFAAFRSHCSFFTLSPAVMKAHREELEAYDKARGTIHFTPKKPLPVALVKKLVKARIAENEARRKK